MSRSMLSATRRHPFLLTCGLVVAALAIQFTATGNVALAHAGPAGKPIAHTPVAPAGPGPVSRLLPGSAQPNHGLPAGQRPPVVPPGVGAGGKAHKLSAGDWARVRKPGGNGVQPKDGPPPSPFGAQNLLLRPGFALGDTSLVLYFDAADPGVSSWSSWIATVFDPDTGSAQDSKSMSPSEATSCGTPRTFCHSFGVTEGWSLVGDHGYFVTITVTLKDGTQAVSLPSGTAKARATAVPPALPAQQAAGCACGDALAPTTFGQAVRGLGVNTGTGGFTMAWTDLRLPGVGIPFSAVRRYSSANTTAGSLGVGWTWTYDLRVIAATGGTTSVTVRAEDGAQVVYTRNADGSYARPPGVRSNLIATADGGWRLVTPDQVTYAFDATGRITSVRNSRGLGTTVAYTATKWTITDAAGRAVTVDLTSAGLVQRITLPDGRAVSYRYTGGLLTAATDAEGDTWTFGYSGTVVSTVTDPKKRVQVTNTYADGRVTKQVDASGAVTQFSWDAGQQQATTLDADHISYLDGYRGNVLVFSQNGNGDTINQRYDDQVDPNLLVDGKGNQTASGFDPAGNVTSVTAPEPFSYTVSNSYDPHNNLTSHQDGLGHTATFGYTSFDELRTITDPGGDESDFTIDDRGLVTTEVDPRGKVTKYGYDAAGNLTSMTTPLGEKTTYTYDKSGRLVSSVDPRGNLPGAKAPDFTTSFSYDGLDRLRKTFQPGKAHSSETVYDSVGQVVKTIDPLQDTTSYDYASVIGRTTTITDPDGNSTRYTYTAAGRRASITDPLGDRTTLAYDNRGNLSTVVSPRGNVKGANPADFTTLYFYDFNQNRVRIRHPYPGGGFADRDTRFDELNRPTGQVDELGKTSSASFDNNSNVVSTVDPLGQTASFTYDVNGRPSAATAPAGGSAHTEYDEAGNPIKQTSATGGVTTWTYDDDGNVVSVVGARGNVSGANPTDFTTTYAYDAVRNLVKVTDPLGHSTQFGYDALNRSRRTTDANGHVTGYGYNDGDRLTTVTGPDAPSHPAGPTTENNNPRPPVTTYEYDPVGHLVSRTDPNGHANRYAYDPAGRLASVTDPLNRQTTYRYDAEGHLTSVVTPGSGDPAPRSIAYTYDILGRRVGADLGHGATIYAYGYDAHNRVTSLADPSGLRLQTYDDAGRLSRVSRGDQAFRYEYDGDSNITSRVWPDGTTLTAGFDPSDRMTSLKVQGGVAGPQPATYGFDYDPSGRLIHTTYPTAGLVTDRGYDPAGRLVDLTSHASGGVVDRYQLNRDPVGNPTAITTTRGTASQTVAYLYDSADRLTGACVTECAPTSTGRASYSYDLVGNRTSQTLAGTAGASTTAYHYDAADQLTETVASGPKNSNGVVTKYGYDDEGNQVRAGRDTFRYNLDHTLASATVNGANASFSYDGQGVQLSASYGTGTGVTTRAWATDVNGTAPRPSLETTTTGLTSTSRGFLNGPGVSSLGLLTGKQVDSYLPDWLGGVADVVAPQGNTQASYDYDAYGNPRTDGTAGASASPVGGGDTNGLDNPVRFTGAYQDPLLGSRYSFPARDYDPATGRFGGIDPVASPVRAPAGSSYSYVGDKPTVFRDPSGARGANADHDAAEELAMRQLDAAYTPFHVYGDAVRPSLMGRPGVICVANPNPPPARSCPDIIVGTLAFTYVYEVKPATDQLSEIKPGLGQRGVNNANQVARYLASLINAGYPNVQTGPDIVPDTTTMADGSQLTIFTGANWNTYARKGARPAANPAGIIYYIKTPPPQPVPVPTKVPNEEPTEEPTANPTEQPTTAPIDQPVPDYVPDQVVDDILVGVLAAVVIVVVVVVVIALLPEEVIAGAAAGLAALASWAFG